MTSPTKTTTNRASTTASRTASATARTTTSTAISPTRPTRAARTGATTSRKRSRTSFGNVRRLPSGRYQARFTDAAEVRHTAPVTFATKRDAEDWLATVRADLVRGTWRAPELSAVTVAD